MLFCTADYFYFFLVVLAAYWALRSDCARVWLLLVASFYFYASWNKRLALLIALTSTVDYILARWIGETEDVRVRKRLLVFGVGANLGLLAYFKYVGFFLASLEDIALQLGLEIWVPNLRVIVPVGISFYTFEAISYLVDVYNKRLSAERRLDRFMLFITFFPHLVAGPIVRARDFLPQVARPKRWSWLRAQLATQLILLGVFKKMAIADRMALFVDPVFKNPDSYGSAAIWVGVISYAIQIYCDFSGYSDIAIGCAHFLGYKLAPNFLMPYQAFNISEFWHRWHISLSSWLRDYLYIPLGGSRLGPLRTVINLMVTMLLGGLWHGASWTYMAWGGFHGLLLVVHRGFRRVSAGSGFVSHLLGSSPGRLFCLGMTFTAVAMGWVLFRCPTLSMAWLLLGRMVNVQGGLGTRYPGYMVLVFGLVIVSCYLVKGSGLSRWVERVVAPPLLGLLYTLLALGALVLAPGSDKAFIYFQF